MAKKAAKAKKTAPKKGAPVPKGKSFMRLTAPQFELFKADLIAEQDSGKAPRTREPVIEQLMAGKRVKGNVLTICSQSAAAIKAMLNGAKKRKDERAVQLYTRIQETYEATPA